MVDDFATYGSRPEDLEVRDSYTKAGATYLEDLLLAGSFAEALAFLRQEYKRDHVQFQAIQEAFYYLDHSIDTFCIFTELCTVSKMPILEELASAISNLDTLSISSPLVVS